MELGERRRRILSAVVNDYVQTAEPVGSQTLVQRYDFGVKPATIRHELATICEMGYLRQPHTSSGRVPSDMGYRYYVDELMPPPRLEPSEADYARYSYSTHHEVDDILQQSCRILSSLTRYTSVATTPKMDVTSVKHVALTLVDERKVLLVTILSTGHIDHRIMDSRGKAVASDVISLGNLLDRRFQGADIHQFGRVAGETLPNNLLKLDWLYAKAISLVKQALEGISDHEVHVEGTTHMLRQPEFNNHDSISAVLEALEHRRALYQILSSALLGKGVTVIIGSENAISQMRECSLVAASYSIDNTVMGTIGVVGPTRMDYRKAVAAVRFMASNLSGLLTSLSAW